MGEIVKMSQCGQDGKMTIPSVFNAVMDIATIHGKTMRVSAEDLAKKDLLWVIARTPAAARGCAKRIPLVIDARCLYSVTF